MEIMEANEAIDDGDKEQIRSIADETIGVCMFVSNGNCSSIQVNWTSARLS